MEIINKLLVIEIEKEFFLSQTEDYNPGDNLSDYSEKLVEKWFLA